LHRQIGDQTLCKYWSGQTLGDDNRIVSKNLKQFPQDLWLFCVAGHPVHLGL
jgi:hypothetical protein